MDQIYSPINADPDEEETSAPQPELSVESWNKFKNEWEEQAGVDKSELTIDQGADEARRRRVEENTPENAFERPIIKLKTKGTSPLTLKEATSDLAFSRGLQTREELLAAGYSENEVQQLGIEKLEAAQRGDPADPPPTEVRLTDKWGNDSDERALSPREAADRLSNWRQEEAQRQAAELEELLGEQQQARQAEAQQAQQQPEQPQPQAQPTPELTEREQLAQERERIANLKRIEGVEASWRHNYDQLRAEVIREFPSLQNGPPDPAHVEQLRIQDPARFQKLAEYDAALRDRQGKIAALTQQRIAREQQQSSAAALQRATARAEQDKAFEQLATQHIPNWESNHGEVRQQARKTLESAGLSQAEIHHLWNGEHSIDVHSSVLQLVLAKAAQWDLAQQRARQIRQAPPPPVMRPGTVYGRGGSGDADKVQNLRAQLASAKGRSAYKVATQLIKAQRGDR